MTVEEGAAAVEEVVAVVKVGVAISSGISKGYMGLRSLATGIRGALLFMRSGEVYDHWN
jgi:isopentenyl diphosphate isomerase/L-lactate dehydrogenase-like FMN-dependent dehydrogenase